MSFPSHIWTTEGVVSKTRDRGRARGRGFFFLSFFLFSFLFFFFENAVVGLVLWLNNPKTTFFLKNTDPNPHFTDKRHYLYVLHTWSRLALLTYFKITSPSLCLLCPPKQVHLIRIKVDRLFDKSQFCCSLEYISDKTSTVTNPVLFEKDHSVSVNWQNKFILYNYTRFTQWQEIHLFEA